MKLNNSAFLEESLKKWKDLFIKEKKALNASKNTIKQYNRALNEFIEFAYLERANNDENLKIEDIKRYFIIAFVEYLKERNLSFKTIKTYLDIVYMFLLFISYYNNDGVDLLYRHKKVMIKLPQHEIIVFNDEEMKKFGNYFSKILDEVKIYSKYKNILALYLLSITGARFNEIATLQFKDIELENSVYKIKLKGKGNKERYVYITKSKFQPYLDKLIRLYLKEEFDYLFLSRKNQPLAYTTLREFFKRVCQKLLIPQHKRNLHNFRHTYATNLLKKGINLKVVSEILGHSDVSITAKYYAKVDEEEKKKAMI